MYRKAAIFLCKQTVRRFLLLTISWVWTLSVCYAQCPNPTTVYRQLTTPSSKKLSARIEQWQHLHDQWVGCRLPADSTFAALLLELGICYFNTDQFSRALYYTRQAIRQSNNSALYQSKWLLIKGYARLGSFLEYQEAHEPAIQALQTCISLTDRYPKGRFWGGYSSIHLAYLYHASGDYQKAVLVAEKGYQIARLIADKDLMARNLHEKARALRELGEWDEAERILNEVFVLTQQFTPDPFDLGVYYRLMGVIKQHKQQWPVALQLYRTAMTIHFKADYLDMYANTADDVGKALCQQANYPEASHYLTNALKYANLSSTQARIYNNIGVVNWKQKQFDRAFRAYQRGLYHLISETDSSHVDRLPSVNAIRQTTQKEYLLTLLQDKADTWLDYAKQRDKHPVYLQNALNTYLLADTLIDYMRWEHTGQQSKLFWREKTRAMYERAIETCYLLSKPAQAFRFIEKSRAVLLTDKLNELGARKQLPPKQLAQEQTLRSQIRKWQVKQSSEKSGNLTYNQSREELLTAQDNLEIFLKQLENTHPAYYRYKYDNTTSPLPDVQRWLSQRNSSLATYFIGDSALYILGITPTKTTFIQQRVGPYQSYASQFNQLLSDPQAANRHFSQLVLVGNQLYTQLLAPLKLPDGRVVISPDGVFLPFDAFSRSSAKADFLVNYNAFSYTYSVNLLLKDRAPGSPTDSFLGIAPVQFSEPLVQSRLQGSDQTVERIGERFSSPTILTHQAASRATFMALAPSHRVIQLFTHADANNQEQEPLLFFADSTLKLSELIDKDIFQSELLVLSACKTGIGTNQKGEGVFSLARGFMSVGIPSIITTLWSVENQPTYQLTELFYRYLADGLPKDEALQQAKKEFIQQGSRADQLPNHWAGFLLIGNAEPLKQEKSLQNWGLLFAVLVLLAAIVWLVQSRQKRAT